MLATMSSGGVASEVNLRNPSDPGDKASKQADRSWLSNLESPKSHKNIKPKTTVAPWKGLFETFFTHVCLEVRMAQSFSIRTFINIHYFSPKTGMVHLTITTFHSIFAFFMVYLYLFGHINTLCTLPHLGTLFPSNIDTNWRNYGNYVQNYHNSREAHAYHVVRVRC